MIQQLKKSIFSLLCPPELGQWRSLQNVFNFIKEQNDRLQVGLPTIQIPYYPASPYFQNTILFRVTEEFPGFDKKNFEHFTYPREFAVISNQRCNYQGYPVFYCGEHPLFSLIEFAQGKVIRDKELYLGIWKLRDADKPCDLMAIIAPNLPKDNSLIKIYKSYEEKIEKMYANIGYTCSIEEYMSLLVEEFTKRDDHRFSQLKSHQFLHEDGGDCIIYPSSQMENRFNNYAFSHNCFQKRFELLQILKIKVPCFDAFVSSSEWLKYNTRLDEVAEVQNNAILHWHNQLPTGLLISCRNDLTESKSLQQYKT